MIVRYVNCKPCHSRDTFFSRQKTHAVELGLLVSLFFLLSVPAQSQVRFPLWHWEQTGFSSSHLTYHVSNWGPHVKLPEAI